MENRDTHELLMALSHLEIDATRACGEAADAIGAMDLSAILSRLCDAHERRRQALSEAIEALGGEPPAPVPDARGYSMAQHARTSASAGPLGTLKAIAQNETLLLQEYDKALREALPEQVGTLVRRHREDATRRLRAVEEALRTRT